MAYISRTTIDVTGATASGESDIIHGFLTQILINFDGVGASTVVAIKQTLNGVEETLYTTPAGNTDLVKRIELPTVDSTNTTTGQSVMPFIPGSRLDFDVSDSSVGTIDIWIISTG